MMKTIPHLASASAILAGFMLWSGHGLTAPYELSECKEVVVVLEDPVEPNGTIGPKVAELACEKFHMLAKRFGLASTGQTMVQLMIADDPDTFHDHTGRGGLTQAIYSKRTGIITQPAKMIRRMYKHKQLAGLLAHELTHYFVGQQAGNRCPIWLNEGLAQWFEPRPHRAGGPTSEAKLAKLELTWRANVPHQVRTWCYRESLAITARLIALVGEDKLLKSLPHLAEMRDPLALQLGSKTMRAWLFPGAQKDEIETESLEAGGPEPEIVRGGRPNKDSLTPLPLSEMLKKAKKNKKK